MSQMAFFQPAYIFFYYFFIGFCYQVRFEKNVCLTFALSAYCDKIMDTPR